MLFRWLFPAKEGLVAKERPKIADDFGLQTRRAKNFRKFPIDVVVGFFEFMEERTQQLSHTR